MGQEKEEPLKGKCVGLRALTPWTGSQEDELWTDSKRETFTIVPEGQWAALCS